MDVTLAQELNLRKASNVAKGAGIALLFILTYLPDFVILHAKYSENDSYYSHGYLIPLVSGFVIWHKRNTLKGMRVAPSEAGLWILGGGLLLSIFGKWWYLNFISASSMLVVLWGLSLSLFGKEITRKLMFPLAFLSFMIPLPKISIIYITFWLKLFVASAGAKVVYEMGIPVLLQGAFLHLPNGVLEVDNACSGLRSLIALTALGVLYAYFLPVSRLKKMIVVLTSLPIAITANLTRIIILVWISYLYGPKGRAFNMADLTTGFLIFVVAFMGLYIVSRAVVGWQRWQMGRGVAPA